MFCLGRLLVYTILGTHWLRWVFKKGWIKITLVLQNAIELLLRERKSWKLLWKHLEVCRTLSFTKQGMLVSPAARTGRNCWASGYDQTKHLPIIRVSREKSGTKKIEICGLRLGGGQESWLSYSQEISIEEFSWVWPWARVLCCPIPVATHHTWNVAYLNWDMLLSVRYALKFPRLSKKFFNNV